MPLPAEPFQMALAAFDGFTDKANANAVARMLGIKRRRDARILTKLNLFFMVLSWVE
jgi:hypothetical protein